jgi:hypothetical protein
MKIPPVVDISRFTYCRMHGFGETWINFRKDHPFGKYADWRMDGSVGGRTQASQANAHAAREQRARC